MKETKCKWCGHTFNPKKAEECVPGTIFCPNCDEEILNPLADGGFPPRLDEVKHG